MATRKIIYGKFGLKEDPRGLHVTWTVGSRTYLATVTDLYRTFHGAIMLKTRHFCGDDAPDVCAACVNVLVRT
jgi:hypothetical protein